MRNFDENYAAPVDQLQSSPPVTLFTSRHPYHQKPNSHLPVVIQEGYLLWLALPLLYRTVPATGAGCPVLVLGQS